MSLYTFCFPCSHFSESHYFHHSRPLYCCCVGIKSSNLVKRGIRRTCKEDQRLPAKRGTWHCQTWSKCCRLQQALADQRADHEVLRTIRSVGMLRGCCIGAEARLARGLGSKRSDDDPCILHVSNSKPHDGFISRHNSRHSGTSGLQRHALHAVSRDEKPSFRQWLSGTKRGRPQRPS